MKHSIATVSLSGTLFQKLEAIANAGFDGIELFETDLITSSYSPLQVKDYCQKLNLEIMLYQPFRNYEGNPREELSQHLRRARKKFDLMAELGIPKILVCSSVLSNTIQSFDVIAEDLFKLAEIAKEYQIEVGYEALAWGTAVNSYRQVWEIVNQVNHPNLGIILDSFHSFSINDDLSQISSIPGDKITFIQLADGPYLKMDVLPWSRHYRNFPGQGDFPLVEFLSPILQAGYKGPLSLEIFNDQFRASPPEQTALDARRSLLYLETITTEALSKVCDSDDSNNACIKDFHPKIDYQGIASLEFTAFNNSAKELKRWLSRLGFKYCGKHEYKEISLYQHGEIRLLINEEVDSYAYAYYLQHGAALSSISFIVDYPEEIYHRAQRYLYSIFEVNNNQNKSECQAVWAPDKSLHYFYTREESLKIFQNSFQCSCENDSETFLERIDHYTLGLPAESLTAWLLYYRSVLDLQAEEELSLPELYGSMKSKLLRSQNNKVNIPLNLTLDKKTQVGRTVSSSSGAGVQHIALSTSNLIEAVQKARNKGILFLSIPDNYYDDLSARFNLDDNFLQLLKDHQILYDQDLDGGSFLHIYTELFEGKFAFELIERREHYQDYGSANTAVRIAASYN